MTRKNEKGWKREGWGKPSDKPPAKPPATTPLLREDVYYPHTDYPYSSFDTAHPICTTHPTTAFVAGGIEFAGVGIIHGEEAVYSALGGGPNLLINLTGKKVTEPPGVTLIPKDTELERELSASLPKLDQQLVLNWPDLSVPIYPPQFWRRMVDVLLSPRFKRVIACCLGGHGRTGSALAILYGLLLKVNPSEAIARVRKLHCMKAVETKAQEEYVARILGALK